MELPSDVWREILTYCNNSIEHQKNEMDLEQLKDTSKQIDSEISKRVYEIKRNLNVYDIVKVKRLYVNIDSEYAMIVSKAKDTSNPFTIRVVMLTPCAKNTQYGYYKATNQHYPSISRIYLMNVKMEVVKHYKDTISSNKLIAKSLKVNDVCEITPMLFLSGCTYNCRHYARVVKIHSYNRIGLQLIIQHYDDDGNRCIVMQNYITLNTKNILKIIDLNDETDQREYQINNYKTLIKNQIEHRTKFTDILNDGIIARKKRIVKKN